MSNTGPSRNPLGRQGSISSLEQSLNMVNLPPAIAPVTIYPGPGAQHANMAKADLELVQRLQHLRSVGGSDAVPSEEEMGERLARLKGLPADYYRRPAGITLNPDRRSHQQMTDDLLTQVMEENNLESRLPNADEALAARLAQVRGVNPGQDAASHAQHHQTPLLDSPGVPQGLDDIDEVAKLLYEVSNAAAADASSAITSLHADPALHSAVTHAVREKKKKSRKAAPVAAPSSSSDERERYSEDSSGGDVKRKVIRVKRMGRSAEKTSGEKLTKEDEEEVSRIVDMYTKRAEDKKKRKMAKKKKLAGGAATTQLVGKCTAKGTDTDSSSELSDSDLNSSNTSDSENLSNTSD